jgi:predicted kinase
MDQQCKLYVLVGVPGSGKSTWYRDQEWLQDATYISTDKHVDTHAKLLNKTYSEVFTDFMSSAVQMMTAEVELAREAGRDIVWDQTSTTLASRSRKFNMLPDYYAIAVVFRTPPRDELDVRLSSRPGKHIPKLVIDNMIEGWEEPTLEEGFKEIWYV